MTISKHKLIFFIYKNKEYCVTRTYFNRVINYLKINPEGVFYVDIRNNTFGNTKNISPLLNYLIKEGIVFKKPAVLERNAERSNSKRYTFRLHTYKYIFNFDKEI